MENVKEDIKDLTDIKLMVDEFYAAVQKDELIGPIFNSVIQNRWPEHLEKMYTFWQTILLETHTYQGRPFPPHAQLPIEREHFDRWLQLFEVNLNNLFSGPIADEARLRAHKMAELFLLKLAHIRKDPFHPLI
ncbi:MAG: group III truncated hemoglobin [Sphingobacterium sp.]